MISNPQVFDWFKKLPAFNGPQPLQESNGAILSHARTSMRTEAAIFYSLVVFHIYDGEECLRDVLQMQYQFYRHEHLAVVICYILSEETADFKYSVQNAMLNFGRDSIISVLGRTIMMFAKSMEGNHSVGGLFTYLMRQKGGNRWGKQREEFFADDYLSLVQNQHYHSKKYRY